MRGWGKGIACSSDLCVRYRCLSSYTHLCVCLHWLCKLILCSRKCKLCGALRIFSRADFCGKISREGVITDPHAKNWIYYISRLCSNCFNLFNCYKADYKKKRLKIRIKIKIKTKRTNRTRCCKTTRRQWTDRSSTYTCGPTSMMRPAI